MTTIPLTMCPLSNLNVVDSLTAHPLARLLDAEALSLNAEQAA